MAATTLGPLQWATSKTVGQVSEVAVFAPIKKGRVPGERCTYEERLRTIIRTIESRVEQGVPNELDEVPTIHFGRLIVIRPEQYLVYSNDSNVNYRDKPDNMIPKPIDDYLTAQASQGPQAEFRSWLLILVSFDGDLKPYIKDIAVFTNTKFDQVFQNCEDYPERGTEDFENFWIWVRRYQINVDLFYPRYSDLTMVRIKQLQAFKRRFDAFVARVRTPTGDRVRSIDELFDEFLRANQQIPGNFPAPGGTFEAGHD